jgi:hypothetical protein
MPSVRTSCRIVSAAALLLAGASAIADERWSVATELGWNRYRIATSSGVENRDALATQVVLGYAPLSPRLEAGVVLLGARWRPGLMGAVVGEWRLGEHWSAVPTSAAPAAPGRCSTAPAMVCRWRAATMCWPAWAWLGAVTGLDGHTHAAGLRAAVGWK